MKRLRETYPSQPNMQARWISIFLQSSIFSFQGSRPHAHLLPARPAAPLAQIHKAPHRPPPIWQVLSLVQKYSLLTCRLVSAFRDKLVRYNGYYYTNYGRKIVTRFRRRAQEKFGIDFFSAKYYFFKRREANSKGQIFPRNNFGSLLPSPGRNSSSLPTWWEFVQYVLATTPRRSFP